MAGAAKVAKMLDPEAKPLTAQRLAAIGAGTDSALAKMGLAVGSGSAAAPGGEFAAVTRLAARERKTKAEATDGVRQKALQMGATLQANAKRGAATFLEAQQEGQQQQQAAEEGSGAVSVGGFEMPPSEEELQQQRLEQAAAADATTTLVPESGALAAAPSSSRTAARPNYVTLDLGGLGGSTSSSGSVGSGKKTLAGGRRAAATPVAAAATGSTEVKPLLSVASDALGKGKGTVATRAIFGFNNLASGVPDLLAKTLVRRTTVTSA